MQQNMMHENLHQIIVQINPLTFNTSNKGRGTVVSVVAADTVAIPKSVADPAHAAVDIPLLLLLADSRVAWGATKVDPQVAQWLTALSLTTPHRWRRDKVSPCHLALRVTLPKLKLSSSPTQPSSRNFWIGALATPVILTWRMAIPACRAWHIYTRCRRTSLQLPECQAIHWLGISVQHEVQAQDPVSPHVMV